MLSPANTNLSTVPSGGQLAFLRRIAEDDQFRAEVEADPQAKLAEFGLQIDRGHLPAQVTLPETEALTSSPVLAGSVWPFSQRWFGFLG